MTDPAPAPYSFTVSEHPAGRGGKQQSLYLIDRDGRKIAAVWGKTGEKEATASLFIAAPAMRAALRSFLAGAYYGEEDYMTFDDYWPGCAKQVRDALAIADGEAKPEDLAGHRLSALYDMRELGTMLAALRFWQTHRAENGDPMIWEIATEAGEPLTNEEIDTLCERINGGEIVA